MKAELIEAMRTNDISSVEMLIKNNPILLKVPLDEDGYYAIHYAVEFGYLASVKLLLNKQETLLNAKTFFGYTPLMIALKTCRYIDPPTFTSLIGLSIPANHFEIITYLIAQVDIDLYAKVERPGGPHHGVRALDFAECNKNVGQKIVEKLKKCNAILGKVVDLDHEDAHIQNILRARDVERLTKILHAHLYSLEKKDTHDVSMLQLSFYMNLQVFEYLVKRFAENNTLDDHVVRILADLKKPPNTYPSSWYSYLKILIEQGLNLDDMRWENEKTLTHYAIDSLNDVPKFEFFEFLVQHNPERLNQIDDLGRTPLTYAAYKKYYKVVKFLVDLGVDQHNEKNKSDSMPAIYEAARVSLVMYGLFDATRYVSPDKRLHDGAHLVHLSCNEVLKKLLDEYPELIDLTDHKGQSLLIQAVLKRDRSQVELLLPKQPNLEFTLCDPSSPYDGFTALDIAKETYYHYHSMDSIVEMLRAAGAYDGSLLRARPNDIKRNAPVVNDAMVKSSISEPSLPPMSNDRYRFHTVAAQSSAVQDSTGLRARRTCTISGVSGGN